MLLHRLARHRGVRGLGIGLLILSLGHMPLPKADYHNIRHHDGPGEVCRFHDHLLRWHPDATSADDVAVLHWHWFLPTPGEPAGAGGDRPAALHSSFPDWSGLPWTDAPQLVPEAGSRFLGRPSASPPATAPDRLGPELTVAWDRAGPDGLSRPFSATFSPRVSLPLLLQRWIC